MPFNLEEPESAGRLNPRDAVGHLLLVWATEYVPHSPTKYTRPDKPSDVVVVDVVDLDLDDPITGLPGLVTRGAWWRQSKLIQALKGKVGGLDPTFAWMSQGTASQGNNAPYVLVAATTDEKAVARAREWESRNPDFKPTTDQPLPPSAQVSQPAVQAREPETDRRSYLERMARSSREGADRLPDPPDDGSIPF